MFIMARITAPMLSGLRGRSSTMMMLLAALRIFCLCKHRIARFFKICLRRSPCHLRVCVVNGILTHKSSMTWYALKRRRSYTRKLTFNA